jgi:hypothetical protein
MTRSQRATCPLGTATKENGCFVKFCRFKDARSFIGRSAERKDGHPVYAFVRDPITGRTHEVVIGRDEETCTWGNARGDRRALRTPGKSLWRDTGTEGSRSKQFEGYVEGEVEA